MSTRPLCAYPECGGGCAECQPAPTRYDLAMRMGEEAAKARLLDPCKVTPDLDAAVADYLNATSKAP